MYVKVQYGFNVNLIKKKKGLENKINQQEKGMYSHVQYELNVNLIIKNNEQQ